MANEKFKKALKDALIPEFSDMLPEADESEHVFSPEFERKMNKLIKRRNKPYYKLINTLGKRVACVAAIVIITSSLTIMNVFSEKKTVIANIYVVTRPGHTHFSVPDYDDNYYLPTIEYTYDITYDMSGFECIEDKTIYDYSKYYYNDDIKVIFKQIPKDHFDVRAGDNKIKISLVNVNEHEALYYIDDKNYNNLYWDNGDYIINLSSNINKEMLIKIAESVQKTE